MLKSVLVATAISVTSLFSVAQAATSSNAPVQAVNGIAAIVNKSVITTAQVAQATANVKAQMQAAHAPIPPDSILRTQVINRLIDEELIKQIAKKVKISVTPHDMKMAITSVAQQNNLSVANLKKNIISSGESYSEFKKQLKQQILLTKVQQQAVAGKVHVTAHEIKTFMAKVKQANSNAREYHVANILIPVTDSSSKTQWSNAKNRAEDIVKQLKGGADFAKLAKLESAGANAMKGGDMGWQSSNDLPDLFVDQLAHMKTGQVSNPLKAGNGYHIIKLLGVKNTSKGLSYAQAKNIVTQKAFQKAVSQWLKALRKSAYIKTM